MNRRSFMQAKFTAQPTEPLGSTASGLEKFSGQFTTLHAAHLLRRLTFGFTKEKIVEFANLGLIPLSFYKNRDYACFFSANSAQQPALYDTREARANSRINARLPYLFLLSRLAHYLKLIQRETVGTTKDRRVLELELNRWLQTLVTEMTDPSDELQAAYPLRAAKVAVEDNEDNPGFFRIRIFIIPHFQIEGMDVNLSLVSQMPKAKS